MEETIRALNQLEQAGVIGRYAIGGAMGAMFYTEPVLTYHLDVFIAMPPGVSGLITLSPLCEALAARGYFSEGECVIIHGVPVQFLPVFNPLIEEALAEARETVYQDTPTRVFRVEHLMAIAIQLGRPKDHQRAGMLRDQATIDEDYFRGVLNRYQLKWAENEKP